MPSQTAFSSWLGHLTSPMRRSWLERTEVSALAKFNPAEVGPGAIFPRTPAEGLFPVENRHQIVADAMDVLQGKFSGFGGQTWKVHTPPVWHRDYLTGLESATTAVSSHLRSSRLQGRLNLRAVWALNRWSHLAILARAFHLTRDEHFRDVIIQWLSDWNAKNPVGRGWNWIGAEEAAARLINLCWLDELARLPESLIDSLLPKHVWWVARYGPVESASLPWLSGLMCALGRWPQVSAWCGSSADLCHQWISSVLQEVGLDGRIGNASLDRQRKLLEFLIPARASLLAREISLPREAEDRMSRATEFLVDMNAPADPWPFGETGEGRLLPSFSVREWITDPNSPAGLWLGSPPPRTTRLPSQAFQTGGDANWKWLFHTARSQGDAGHQDLHHLSLWIDGLAVFIDPGSGFPNPEDHNGPRLETNSSRSRLPALRPSRGHQAHRRIDAIPDGWQITDTCGSPFATKWVLAPGWEMEPHGNAFILFREGHSLEISVKGAVVACLQGKCSPSYGLTAEAPALQCDLPSGGQLETQIVSRQLL